MDALEAAIREHLRLRDGEEPTEEQVRGLLEEESVLAPLDADRRRSSDDDPSSPQIQTAPETSPNGSCERPVGGSPARERLLNHTVRAKTSVRVPRPGLALVAVGLLALVVIGALGLLTLGPRLMGADSSAQQQSAKPPGVTAAEYARVADRIARAWERWQLPDGTFRDYINGRKTAEYGVGMIGYAMLRAGERAHDRRLVRSGIRALNGQLGRFGEKFGVFDLLTVSEAYNFTSARLTDDPVVRRARPRWRRPLREVGFPAIGEGAYKCVVAPDCFHNHEAVEAAADALALKTGLRSSTPGAKLADHEALREELRSTLADKVPQFVGDEARSSGPGPRRGLGLLSDSQSYPLAYHALSVAMLARSLSAQRAPTRRARSAFGRAAESLGALMAPDGDVAYIGRRQQEAWALAAAGYVGEAAAGRFDSSPERAARFQALGRRALSRLVAVHGFGPSGINVVPRFGRSTRTYRGTDANNVVFNGLTAYLLNLAADEAAENRRRPTAPLTADRDGFFLDRTQARFAAVRRGRVWFAVHADQEGFRDPRGDFGLVALKWRSGQGHWVDLLRPRPLGGPRSVQAGPSILTAAGERLVFIARRIEVRADGSVTLRGRFTGTTASRPATMRFVPRGDGVGVRFPVRAGDVAEATTFLSAEDIRREAGGISDRLSLATLSPPAQNVETERGFASCCDARLTAATLSARAERDQRVSYVVRARPKR